MKSWVVLLGMLLACVIMAACSPRGAKAPPGDQDVMAAAAAEATAIVQQAQATAMVLQARIMATALIERAGAVPATPAPTEPTLSPVGTSAPARPVQTPGLGEEEENLALPVEPENAPGGETGEEATPEAADSAAVVELLGIGFAADGGFIMVQFRAPPQIATTWHQGSVSVTEEATGKVYNEIPVMPVIGPLIGRPVEAGQLGYAMLVNAPTPLRSGAVVTVVLGDYKFEHQTVQG